jgi:hypothetical protein
MHKIGFLSGRDQRCRSFISDFSIPPTHKEPENSRMNLCKNCIVLDIGPTLGGRYIRLRYRSLGVSVILYYHKMAYQHALR